MPKINSDGQIKMTFDEWLTSFNNESLLYYKQIMGVLETHGIDLKNLNEKIIPALDKRIALNNLKIGTIVGAMTIIIPIATTLIMRAILK